MAKYFAQDTPQAGLERMMMTVPGFKPRGGGTMILNRFHYRPEDVDCRNCLHSNVQICILSVCPYISRNGWRLAQALTGIWYWSALEPSPI